MASYSEYKNWLKEAQTLNPDAYESDLMDYYFNTYGEPEDLYQPDDTRGEFTKGLTAGIDQTQGLLYGSVGMAGSALGLEGVKDWGIEGYQRNMEEAAESPGKVQRIEDIGGVGDFGNWAMYQLGNLTPTMATMLLTGGVGGAIAKGVAKKGVTGMAAKEAAKRLGAAQFTGQSLGAMAGSTALESGGIYADLHEIGEDRPGVALAFGSMAGLMDALPVMRVFSKFGIDDAARIGIAQKIAGDKLFPRILAEAGVQGTFEGLTEGAQTIIERAAMKYVDENKEIFTEEGWSEIMNAMAAGSLMGGAMGPITGLPQSRRDQGEPKDAIGEIKSKVTNDIEGMGRLSEVEEALTGPVIPTQAEMNQREIDRFQTTEETEIEGETNLDLTLDEAFMKQFDQELTAKQVGTGQLFEEAEYNPEWGPEKRILAELHDEAAAFDEVAADRALEESNNFETVRDKLKGLIAQGYQNEQIAAKTRGEIPVDTGQSQVEPGARLPTQTQAPVVRTATEAATRTEVTQPTFTPTHELADGTPVIQSLDDAGKPVANEWIDQDGTIVEDAGPTTTIQTARPEANQLRTETKAQVVQIDDKSFVISGKLGAISTELAKYGIKGLKNNKLNGIKLAKKHWPMVDELFGFSSLATTDRRTHGEPIAEEHRSGVARRQNLDMRKKVMEMTDEEKGTALLISDKAGIRNERAYNNEDERLKVQSFFDIDDFKDVNTRLTYEGGDQILGEVGRVMREEAKDLVIPYHLHGDEFIVQSNDQAKLDEFSARVQDKLKNAIIDVRLPSGEVITVEGIGVSYGIGQNKEQAETQLKADKERRKEAGIRQGRRGKPDEVSGPATEGQQDNQGQDTGQVTTTTEQKTASSEAVSTSGVEEKPPPTTPQKTETQAASSEAVSTSGVKEKYKNIPTDLPITLTVQVGNEGETRTIQMTSEQALNELAAIDEKTDAYKKLMDCLS
jgi:diguanylate cyclase (GGDEF)-like protein